MKLKVHPVKAADKKYKGQTRRFAEALVQLGPVPYFFGRLAKPKDANDYATNQYKAWVILTEEQRAEVIAALAPVAVEIAKEQGIAVDLKKATSIIKDKLKEMDEPGQYRLIADANIMRGTHIHELPVKGPDDGPLERPYYLTKGSEILMNFTLKATKNPETNKVNFPFDLEAVKVVKAEYYEREDNGDYSPEVHDDFDALESDY